MPIERVKDLRKFLEQAIERFETNPVELAVRQDYAEEVGRPRKRQRTSSHEALPPLPATFSLQMVKEVSGDAMLQKRVGQFLRL